MPRPLPKASWCQSDVPGISGPAPRARGFDQLSRVTRAWVRGPAGSISCPGCLAHWSEGTRGLLAVPVDSGPCPRARVVVQLSRAIRACVLGYTGSTSCPGKLGPGSEGPRGGPAVPGDSGPCPRAWVSNRVPGDSCLDLMDPGSTSGPGGLRPISERPRVRQPVPGDAGRCPNARGVVQLSRATWAHAQYPAGSTSSPGLLGPWSEPPQCRPAIPGDSGPCPRPRGVDQISQVGLSLGPKAHGGDQLYRLTRVRFRGHAGLTGCPRALGPRSEGLRCRPALLGALGPCPRANWVHQLSRATRAHV